MTTTEVYITDKSGNKYFNTLCGSAYAMSEVRNLEQKIEHAKRFPQLYTFLDIASSEVMVHGECGDYFTTMAFGKEPAVDMSDDELLHALGVA